MPFKKTLFRSFSVLRIGAGILLICVIIIPVGIAFFGLQSSPTVPQEKKLSLDDVKRIRQVMRENDPRRLKNDEVTILPVAERDLNLLLYYGLSHSPFADNLSTRVHLHPDFANILLTYNLPDNPIGKYLNMAVKVIESRGEIPFSIEKLEIGSVGIPGLLIDALWQHAQKYLARHEAYGGIIEGIRAIESIQFETGELHLAYKWQKKISVKIQKQGRDMLLPVEERKRLLAYNQRLKNICQKIDKKTLSLTGLLQPLFQAARERTVAGGNPAAENRALILTATIFILGRDLDRIVGRPRPVGSLTIPGQENRTDSAKEKKQASQPKRLDLTLRGRNDLALHFMVSAALTVSAGGGMADLLGLFKEMDDSRGGSGFSFADLAADLAGVKLAGAATGATMSADLLQQKMSGPLKEDDFMPRVDQLPEGIMELEFRKKYKDLESANYRVVNDEIERRIAECRIYRE